jgi:hypothetical protein
VRRLSVIAIACALLALTAAAAVATPYGRVGHNPADRLASKPIDDYRYDRAKHCYKRPSKGANAMVAWLTRNARGQFWGIMRCERLSHDSMSLHSEGRAIDWHLDVGNAADRRAARRLILTLLATDRAGNPHALARRMGIQEIIWNCHSWWSGADRMGPYSLCYTRSGKLRKKVDRTLAHRNHVHIGLSRQGARMRTSFWAR